MADRAYAGALTRAVWGRSTPVPGIDRRHTDGTDDSDPFAPAITTPSEQAGDVWQPTEHTGCSGMGDEPIHHWTPRPAAVPANVPRATAMDELARRMIATHQVRHHRPDTARAYTHDGIAKHRDWRPGRSPQVAGQSAPEDMTYLLGGHNAYDQRNGITDVYSADTGRYRLGTECQMMASYRPGNAVFSQSGWLRAYEGLHPQLPTAKTVENPPPVIPPSAGTTRWRMPSWQAPRMFSLPAESEGTEYQISNSPDTTYSEFREDGRL